MTSSNFKRKNAYFSSSIYFVITTYFIFRIRLKIFTWNVFVRTFFVIWLFWLGFSELTINGWFICSIRSLTIWNIAVFILWNSASFLNNAQTLHYTTVECCSILDVQSKSYHKTIVNYLNFAKLLTLYITQLVSKTQKMYLRF